jgi:hypothetical protein
VQGEAQDVELDPLFGQTATAIAVDAAGVHLAWQEDSTTSTAPTAWSTTLGGTPSLLGDPGGRPHVAPGPWYVWDSDGSDIVVEAPGAAAHQFGLAGQVHSARLAVSEGAATVLWMEVVSGVRNRLHVSPVEADGTPGVTTSLATEGAPAVYPVDLTMVDSSHAVVVYQDGASPNFRVKADWITLSR